MNERRSDIAMLLMNPSIIRGLWMYARAKTTRKRTQQPK